MRVDSQSGAEAVWEAAPYMLKRCNEQASYERPFAAEAYAWLHFLDRYARSWRAFEVLVKLHCLPMTRYGVNALDIGTGPGPSAFAAHDFYQSMTSFARTEGVPAFNQICNVSCVEYDNSTNQLRAQIVGSLIEPASAATSLIGIGSYVRDFGSLNLAQKRRRTFEALRRDEDEYYDETRGEWTSDVLYTSEEANEAAQGTHRYRLFTFSNFFTTITYRISASALAIMHSPGSADFRWRRSRRRQTTPPHSRNFLRTTHLSRRIKDSNISFASLVRTWSCIGVAIGPGLSTFTRIFLPFSSLSQVRANERNVALLAEYTP